MKITYLKHSALYIEMDHCILLFDDAFYSMQNIKADKKIYIFITHHHQDHYHPSIFDYKNHFKVQYIISDDIQTREDVLYVSANREYRIDALKIQTLKSTDEGVAFMIECEGKKIFYCGDLHLWDWGSEDTREEHEQMYQAYVHEIQKMKGMHFDLCTMVVDPRLKERMCLAIDILKDYITCDVLIPIHMWEEYSILNNWKKYCLKYDFAKHIIIWKHALETIEIL